jgi:putative transposase
MSDKFRERYRIPSARAQWWNYGNDAAYFITICTAGRNYDFGKIIDGEMVFSKLGLLAKVFWHEITNHCKTVELDTFVVMPNHVHGILILTKNEKICEVELGDCDDISNDNCSAVETRHALSQLKTNVDADMSDKEHETRHALSLQHHRQDFLTTGQRRFQNQGKKTISSIVGSYKSAVSKHAHRLGINFDWQPRFHDHIIRSDIAHQRISNYIRYNVSNWENDEFYLE